MKSLALTTALALAAIGSAEADEGDEFVSPSYEEVDSFYVVGHIDGWRAIDGDTLILWANPFRPYLVELTRESPELRFSEAIGVTSTLGKVSKFDTVIVDGWHYPIRAIYKLDREQARELRRTQTIRENV